MKLETFVMKGLVLYLALVFASSETGAFAQQKAFGQAREESSAIAPRPWTEFPFVSPDPPPASIPIIVQVPVEDTSIGLIERISLGISCFALIVSWAVFIINFRYTSHVTHNGFFLEIDKRLMDDPCMWEVIDAKNRVNTFDSDKKISPEEMRLKKKAFAYFLLNSFDSIFNYYQVGFISIVSSKIFQKAPWKSWNRYFETLYINSPDFRDVVRGSVKNGLYGVKFCAHLKSIQSECDKKIVVVLESIDSRQRHGAIDGLRP